MVGCTVEVIYLALKDPIFNHMQAANRESRLGAYDVVSSPAPRLPDAELATGADILPSQHVHHHQLTTEPGHKKV